MGAWGRRSWRGSCHAPTGCSRAAPSSALRHYTTGNAPSILPALRQVVC